MKNITLALDENIIKKSRQIAAQQGQSLNSLIRSFLARLCGENDQSEEGEWLDNLFEEADNIVEPAKINWKRDELHRF